MKLARASVLLALSILVMATPVAATPSQSSQSELGTGPHCAGLERIVDANRSVSISPCLSPSQPATSAPVDAPLPIPTSVAPCEPDVERCETWVSEPYDGPIEGREQVGWRWGPDGNLAGNTVAASPDGERVFTAATSEREGELFALTTLAHDASDGSQLWTEAIEPPGGATEVNPVSILTGDNSVFVTGFSLDGGEGFGFTRAYDAVTGATLWHRPFPGWANHSAISDDGTRLFVVGDAWVPKHGRQGRIVAYDAATGEPVWEHTFVDPKDRFLMPWRLDSVGDRVAVAIAKIEVTSEDSFVRAIHVATYDASGADEGAPVSYALVQSEGAMPAGIALNADASRAFVVQHVATPLSLDLPTYVFSVDTVAGELAWGKYFLGWPYSTNLKTSTYPWHIHPIEVSPQGSVILSAYSIPLQTVTASPVGTAFMGYAGTFVTTSLDGATGVEQWRAWEPATAPDSDPAGQFGPAVSVNPATGQVVMVGTMFTGGRLRPVTYGYSPSGEREWMRISNQLPQGSTLPVSEGNWSAVVHSADGSRVFEAGYTSAIFNDAASSPDVIVAAFDTAA